MAKLNDRSKVHFHKGFWLLGLWLEKDGLPEQVLGGHSFFRMTGH